MRLFHFSEEAGIVEFVPRPVRVPAERGPGREWLNGPLVWAIDELRQPMYLFPRDCPRILLWPTPETNEADRAAWWGRSRARMLAFVEAGWVARLASTTLWRYELPAEVFEDLGESGGGWVGREMVRPLAVQPIVDLPAALAAEAVELRVLADLTPLKGVWDTTLHASGVRLRNARGWAA